MENVYLYNIDDLKTIADGYLKQRQEEIARMLGGKTDSALKLAASLLKGKS